MNSLSEISLGQALTLSRAFPLLPFLVEVLKNLEQIIIFSAVLQTKRHLEILARIACKALITAFCGEPDSVTRTLLLFQNQKTRG